MSKLNLQLTAIARAMQAAKRRARGEMPCVCGGTLMWWRFAGRMKIRCDCVRFSVPRKESA